MKYVVLFFGVAMGVALIVDYIREEYHFGGKEE